MRHDGKETGARGQRSGTTVVEVMVAAVVLSVIALAGGAFLAYSRSQVFAQRNRRAALSVANSRLEAVRGSQYDDFTPTLEDYTVYYLAPVGSSWTLSTSDPGETISINGRSMPITTTVSYVDIDGGTASYDCVRVRVSVGYRSGRADRVTLETIVAP